MWQAAAIRAGGSRSVRGIHVPVAPGERAPARDILVADAAHLLVPVVAGAAVGVGGALSDAGADSYRMMLPFCSPHTTHRRADTEKQTAAVPASLIQ